MPLPHREIISTHALLAQRMLLPLALAHTTWLSELSRSIAPDSVSAAEQWAMTHDAIDASVYIPLLAEFQRSLYALELFTDGHASKEERNEVLLESRRLMVEMVESIRAVVPEMVEMALTFRSFDVWVEKGSVEEMGAMADFGGDLRVAWWARSWRREGW
jgi:hypothetical protein